MIAIIFRESNRLMPFSRDLKIMFCCKRFRNKNTHWSELLKKKYPKDKALQHFDDLYSRIYTTKWPSIRLALLSQHKYCALVNNFGDVESTITTLENNGALNIRNEFLKEMEKIQVKSEIKSTKAKLNKIFKMDKELNDIVENNLPIMTLYNKSENALNSVNENGVNNSSVEVKENKSKFSSLYENIKNAEFDKSRIIRPSDSLTEGSMYEFIPATKLQEDIDISKYSEHYNYYQTDAEFPINIKKEKEIHFPEQLKMFGFFRGNVWKFPEPKRGSTGVFNYYLMDGSSLLPVLALDLKPNDIVLDMCAAPGGKALIMIQTLYPGFMVLNDLKLSRVKRIESVLEQFLYDSEENKIKILCQNGAEMDESITFDKILVDVPCTTDRHSVLENDNNIFKSTRIQERMKLPEIQSALLVKALKLVNPGGTVVYSTCSLSPIQNEGVIHMALKRIWEETKFEIEVRNLNEALIPFKLFFDFGKKTLKFGSIVVPFLPNNYGPMYFCKLVRNK